MRLTFHGVRGSCPSPYEANRRYGGNTACVSLEEPDDDPIIFDLGTGLRPYGALCPLDGTFSGTALVTHLHWDHVQGLPFFAPVHVAGARLDIYGPTQEEGSLGEVFGRFMRPPYFPVQYTELGGEVTFHDVTDDVLAIGSRKVTVRLVPHTGPTLGYRVDGRRGSVTYISDHQAPIGLDTVSDTVLELASEVDVLIHDAQYTPEEFSRKADWGHCTLAYALLVAQTARAKRLVLFHHDPWHSDDDLDRLFAETKQAAEGTGVEVFAAYEGLVIEL